MSKKMEKELRYGFVYGMSLNLAKRKFKRLPNRRIAIIFKRIRSNIPYVFC